MYGGHTPNTLRPLGGAPSKGRPSGCCGLRAGTAYFMQQARPTAERNSLFEARPRFQTYTIPLRKREEEESVFRFPLGGVWWR